MLDDAEIARLDRLWDELHFVSHDALTLVDAFAQLMEYATQDSDPKLFEPYRKPILDTSGGVQEGSGRYRAEASRSAVGVRGDGLSPAVDAAGKEELRELYRKLRTQELPHDEAIRLTLAKVLVTPAFLYRLEKARPVRRPPPSPMRNWRLG